MNFNFKTYSWSIGTTSFRVKEVNLRIEQQLRMLKELFEENPNKKWRELQEKYYDKLQEEGEVKGNAKIKDKDARQKTSVLKELGLVNKERHITEVGKELLKLMDSGELTTINEFMIENDSLLYLKQLLKVYIKDQEFNIKPFIALLYFIDKLEYLTYDEFTYLLPICKNAKEVKNMVKIIQKYRVENINTPIYPILLKKMYTMDNYKEAFTYFENVNIIDENVICNIGMNRKSKKYDKVYFDVYKSLENLIPKIEKNSLENEDIKMVLKAIKKLASKAKRYWILYLFGNSQSESNQIDYFRENIFLKFKCLKYFRELSEQESKTKNLTDRRNAIKEFRKTFFNMLHIFKWRINLEEYSDLNRRYFTLSDILIFKDNKIEMTLYAKHFFHLCIDELLEEEINTQYLTKNIPMNEISKYLNISYEDVVKSINKDIGKNLDLNLINDYFDQQRYNQLNTLIEDKFKKETLIEILDLIEKREDEKIQKLVTDKANIPTIFEYISGIIWYIISDYSFDLLKSWNLSLDANMFPKSHATGGNADIVIDYKKNDIFDEHKLMIEVTLTNGVNQRRAEMEPVSRHLARLKADNPNKEVYTVFISNYLDENVVIDFRSRKDIPYRDKKTGKYIEDNKIIPIGTQELRKILEKDIKYNQIYEIFNNAYNSSTNIKVWYSTEIKSKIV